MATDELSPLTFFLKKKVRRGRALGLNFLDFLDCRARDRKDSGELLGLVALLHFDPLPSS